MNCEEKQAGPQAQKASVRADGRRLKHYRSLMGVIRDGLRKNDYMSYENTIVRRLVSLICSDKIEGSCS
jgi:hypothetical protein